MFHLILFPASRKYTAWKEYWTWWMLTVIWVVMLFSRQFRFPFVLPLHSMLLCIPLRVVRFSLLKNIFLPFISFRRRSNFECICCITDATKPVSSYAAPRRSTLLCITAPEAACYCSWQWAQRSGRYRIQGGGKTITVRDSGFGAPDGDRCWGIVWEDPPKEHGLLLVWERVDVVWLCVRKRTLQERGCESIAFSTVSWLQNACSVNHTV